MTVETAQTRQHLIADALCAQWRLFERVTLIPAADGVGFRATIHLNPTLVRGAAEQQGSNASPARLAAAEARRAKAIADRVERFNVALAAAEKIRDYEVIT